ncbi:MAG: hypothetical protein NTX25_08205 [Proteobacteria bacterium]|nr:hypothetical protein [Pseudomonadota bacterium]
MKLKQKLTPALLIPLLYLAFLVSELNQNPKPMSPKSPPQLAKEPKRAEAEAVQIDVIMNKLKAQRKGHLSRLSPVEQTTITATQADQEEAVAEVKPADQVHIPRPVSNDFKVVVVHGQTSQAPCPIDRPCQPQGRQGVLVVGANISVEGWQSKMGSIWSAGSYKEQTPLLVYK